MTLDNALSLISPPFESSKLKAKEKLDKMAKPIGSFGEIESIIIKASGILGDGELDFGKKCVIVFCADNGVVDEGISQSTSEVTSIVAEKIARGEGNISCVCRSVGADVFVVDVGMKNDGLSSKIDNKKIKNGTNNIRLMPAMTRSECIRAIEVGINKVVELKDMGYKLFAFGEMGIGNTSSSLAVASALLELDVYSYVGVGAGLKSSLLENKARVISQAINKNSPNKNDVLDVLSKLGGFDICAMTGAFLACSALRLPCIIDGVISSVSALCGFKLNKFVSSYLFPSHLSRERLMERVMRELELKPILDFGMYLGEGTGAAMLMPIFDIAQNIYNEMGSFSDFKLKEYEDYRGR